MKKAPHSTTLIKAIRPCQRILGGSLFDVISGYLSPVDEKGRYLHWNDICNKTDNEEKRRAIWSLINLAREHARRPIQGLSAVLGTGSGTVPLLMILPGMQKTCSLIDRRCTRAALAELTQEVSASTQFLHMFAHDEGIASSQLEGASTTRTVAKQMLEEKREPRSEDEQMILGNHRLMQLTWESRHEDMTLPLLLQFHATACKGIDDDKYSPGALRDDDSVYVAGRDDEIIHVPPSATLLPELLGSFVNWINIQHEENVKPSHYIHPVIKACIMHFSLGYIHPFFDGNGRVARALCYWQLFRHGYELFKYVSISKLLKAAPIQYGEAYLKTETDHLDVTYFVDYQCRIFERAVNETLEHVRESSLKLREFNSWLFNHGFLSRLSDIQRVIFNEIIIDPESRFLVSDFSQKAGISESAARQNLEKLFEAGLLLKSGGGGSKPVVYTPKKSLDKIKQVLIEMNKK